jgi:hypothetical protein
MTALATWFLIRQPVIAPDDDRDRAPSTIASRAVLSIVATVTLVWGIALFVTDGGPSALVWAWPGDLLSSRLIGVMLLAIGVGCAYALPRADTARLMEITAVVYSAGLAVASLWGAVLGTPVKPAYVGAFAVVALLCVVALIAERRVSEAPAPGGTTGERELARADPLAALGSALVIDC